MSISGIAGTALSGMRAQTTRISAIASNVANSSAPGHTRLNTNLTSAASGGVEAIVSPTASDVDLATELTDLIEAEQSYKANAVVFETGADMWEMLMSIKRD
ncbi:flagellar basal body rod C-terminal domain-containing protein [Rhizobium hidalgonense]|uniref:Flagellar basal body rod C-terminal domain-containing protein n=1 Tax=Rhizobium hidalgonense TaxID=1538159 RepID=A0A2A6KK61_9HYPH|nr:flagellar basal body rod C-terminal domain-containing protein [Rhizobium hidalgonense]MDR9771272.1 flagellar basal body rod C-terminal domain-containing protein [Rhizobium hidalgonense]MDR9809173.1 flagellar basal body rod C-terminal domain-containing protein [Rhizobium hidalgonense]MDR9818698.1 flagellar basal body rod C-terminal domain-containing protein [Rhizobium hidalgonense]PDT25276.1 flagellar basal body rod protein [Rhizobium hidalgonense]PON07410.1 flagellar basal body rod protein 